MNEQFVDKSGLIINWQQKGNNLEGIRKTLLTGASMNLFSTTTESCDFQ